MATGVSHRMDAVTRLRPIWKRLAVEHEATVLLYKRLDLCTSGELEQLEQVNRPTRFPCGITDIRGRQIAGSE